MNKKGEQYVKFRITAPLRERALENMVGPDFWKGIRSKFYVYYREEVTYSDAEARMSVESDSEEIESSEDDARETSPTTVHLSSLMNDVTPHPTSHPTSGSSSINNNPCHHPAVSQSIRTNFRQHKIRGRQLLQNVMNLLVVRNRTGRKLLQSLSVNGGLRGWRRVVGMHSKRNK